MQRTNGGNGLVVFKDQKECGVELGRGAADDEVGEEGRNKVMGPPLAIR